MASVIISLICFVIAISVAVGVVNKVDGSSK